MTKGKVKNNSSDGIAPPEPQSLRSRKREHPSDDASWADDVQVMLHQQDTEKNNTAMVTTPLPCPQFPLQECATITKQQGAVEPCLTKQEGTRSPSQTCTDQLQVFILTSEEGDGSCATALEEGANENSQCNLERNQETTQEQSSSMCKSEVQEIRKESAAGIPTKKKRRIVMCGLTEKEQSHFLQTQKLENGQNGVESVEKLMCINTASDLAAQDELSSPPLPSSPLSIPVGSVEGQSEAEIILHSSHCVEDNRAETEAYVAVTTSDGTNSMCDPGCSEGKSYEAEASTLSGPEQTSEPKSEPLAQEKVGLHSGNLEQQEAERNLHQIEGIEKEEGSEAAHLQVQRVARFMEKREEEMMEDAGDGAEAGSSSTDTRPGGDSCGSVELCGAAVTPSASDRKDSRDPDIGPAAGPPPVKPEHWQTIDTTDLFGSGSLDFVSDSQLNSIVLTVEKETEGEEDPGFSVCHEDATELVCGLIRELSFLNQKVMATHRELENLRRGNKTSRSSIP